MTMFLLALTGYQFFTEEMHEWLGMILFALFVAHNILNFHWYRGIFRGRYSIVRVIYLVIDILVLISMFMQMYSGIVMSRHVFDFFDIQGNMSMVRRMHILGAYWGFLFIGLHLGVHWSMLMKHFKIRLKSRFENFSKLPLFISMLIALYGVYALIKRDFSTYLFLKSEFVFMDFNESPIYFYLDYLAIMGFCIFIAHFGLKLILNKKKQISNKKIR